MAKAVKKVAKAWSLLERSSDLIEVGTFLAEAYDKVSGSAVGVPQADALSGAERMVQLVSRSTLSEWLGRWKDFRSLTSSLQDEAVLRFSSDFVDTASYGELKKLIEICDENIWVLEKSLEARDASGEGKSKIIALIDARLTAY